VTGPTEAGAEKTAAGAAVRPPCAGGCLRRGAPPFPFRTNCRRAQPEYESVAPPMGPDDGAALPSTAIRVPWRKALGYRPLGQGSGKEGESTPTAAASAAC
jgi:hypothetical protein